VGCVCRLLPSERTPEPVASDTEFAIDLYSTRELAEAALAEVLADESAFASLLRIEEIASAFPARELVGFN
jgi:hypothetical protein